MPELASSDIIRIGHSADGTSTGEALAVMSSFVVSESVKVR